MKNIISKLWAYFRSMNSEPGTQDISIKRNLAWGIGTLMFIVEMYSLHKLPISTLDEIKELVYVCVAYVVIDALFVLLVLGITSIEKVQSAILMFRGGAPAKEPIEEPKENQQ